MWFNCVNSFILRSRDDLSRFINGVQGKSIYMKSQIITNSLEQKWCKNKILTLHSARTHMYGFDKLQYCTFMVKTIKWFWLRWLVESDLFYCGFSSPKPLSNLSVSVLWLYLKTKISTTTKKLPRFCPRRRSPGLPCAFLKSVSSLIQKASGGPRMML